MNATPHSILIVSDDAREREALVALLRGVGHQTFVAETCEEALSSVRRHPPTVALIDLWLADLPGHVVLHGVRQASPETECIALLTTPAQQEGAYEALKLGAFTFLRRAHDTRLLLNVVGRAIERHELLRDVADVKARLATLFAAIPAGILVVDQQTRRVVEANPAAVQFVGASREDIIGSVLQARPLVSGEAAPAAADARQTGRRIPATRTVATMTIGGRRHQVECFLDISGRFEVEDRLAAMVAVSALLAEDVHDLVMTVDREGRLLQVHGVPPRAAQSREFVVGRSAAECMPAGIRERYRQGLDGVFRTGEGVSLSGGTPPFDAWSLRIVPVISRGDRLAAVVRVRDLDDLERTAVRLRVRGVAADAIREPLLVFNAEGAVVDANAAARTLLDYYGAELLGLAFAQLEQSAPPRAWAKLWAAAVLHGHVDFDTHLRRRDGAQVAVHAVLRHVRVEGAAVVLALLEDHTAEEQAAISAAELDARERSLLDAQPEPFWLLDRQGRVSTLNAAAVRLGGRAMPDLVGRPYGETLQAATAVAQARLHRMEDVFVHGQAVHLEDDVGACRYAVTISPVRGREGVVVLAALLARDVTHLRLQERRWSALWQLGPVGLLTLDAAALLVPVPGGGGGLDGVRIEEANPEALRLFGATSVKPLRSLVETMPPGAADSLAAVLRAWLSGQEPSLTTEQALVTRDGARLHARLCWMRAAGGEAPGRVTLMLVDRTEFVQNRQQVLELNAQERQRMAGTLAAAVLPAVDALEAAGVRLASAESPDDAVRAWQAALATLKTRVQALCAGWGGAGEGTPASLIAAFSRLAEAYQRVWGLNCRCNVRTAALITDRGVGQHLVALAREALDHAARARRAGTASITLSAAPGEGLLSVKDDGQAPSTDEDAWRTDMALRLMREHAAALGGALSLAAEPRGGALLQCRFPLA